MATRTPPFRFQTAYTIIIVTVFLLFETANGSKSSSPTKQATASTTPNGTLRVVTNEDVPLVIPKGSGYEGFLVDIYNNAFAAAGQKPPPLMNASDHVHSDEIIQQLSNGVYDIALMGMDPTAERAKLVSFTQPFYSDGFRVLYNVYDTSSTVRAMETLVKPFTPGLWVLLVVMFFVSSLCMFAIGRMSPYEGVAMPDKPSVEEKVTLASGASYLYGVLTWQGSTTRPRSLAGRCLSFVWWIFALLVVTSYIAGLSTTLWRISHHSNGLPFTTLDEMSRQDDVGILVVKDGSALTYLKQSKNPLEMRILAKIMEHKKHLIINNDDVGLQMMRENKGKYVMLVSGPVAEQVSNSKPCDLTYLPESFGSVTFCVACRKDVDACDIINEGILSAFEDGTISELRLKWFQSKCTPDATFITDAVPLYESLGVHDYYVSPLTVSIQRFSAALILLGVGLVVALAILFGEVILVKRQDGPAPSRFDGSEYYEDDDITTQAPHVQA